jgi:hypothetical protein
MTTIHGVQPWYLRDEHGVDTGLSYPDQETAREAAAVRPRHTVHQETADRAGQASFATTAHTQRVSDITPRAWKRRGYGGVE